MRGKKIILMIAILLVGLALAFVFLKPKPVAPRVLPNPNGYDEIVAAVKQMPSKTDDVRTLAEADLRAFVQSNAVTLRLCHEALQKPCAVSGRPFETNTAYLDDISSFKRAAFCFIGAGVVAEKDHRYGAAAGHYLDAIRLGATGMKDGVVMDRLVAVACESIGTKPLKTMVDKLSAKECRDVLDALEKIDQERDPIETTLANERDFMRAQSTTFSRQLAGLVMFRSTKTIMERSRAKVGASLLLERQLMIDLAARAFELEKGKRPATAQELAPEYLKVLPLNPTNGTNLAL